MCQRFRLISETCYSPCPSPAPVLANGHWIPNPEKNSTAEVNKAARDGAKRTMKALSVAFPFSAMPFVYGALSKALSYTRHMNLSPSHEMEELYSEPDDNVQLFPAPTLSDETKDKFPQHRLPEVFERYELPSSFLVNFGEDILAVFMFLLVAFIVNHLSRYLRNIQSPRFLAIKAKLWL